MNDFDVWSVACPSDSRWAAAADRGNMVYQLIANALVSASLYALVSLGFSLIYRSTRVFHFAHAAVYTSSAYTLYVCVVHLHLQVVAGFAVAVIISILLGLALERCIYYPLVVREAPTGVVLISSIGINTVLVNLVAAMFGNDAKSLRPGASHAYSLGGVILTQTQLVEVAAAGVVCALTLVFVKFSTAGRLIRALIDNPALVPVIGIDARKLRLLSFAIGSALAGTAACLVALDIGMDPYNGLNMLLIAAVSVIIGGLKVLEGAALGSFLLAFIQHAAVYQFSANWEQPITFLLLIVFLLFRPTGILGKRGRLEEL